MRWLLSVYIGLGIALAFFIVGHVLRRRSWVIAGTAVAAPTGVFASVLFWAAPPWIVFGVIIACGLSAWTARRTGRLMGPMLLLPFFAFIVATVLRVPLTTDTDGTSAIGVALGDLDGDSDLDIVLARGHHSPMTNVVLLNDGTGHFRSYELNDIADKSFSVALGDLDGDGDLDAIIGNDRHDLNRIHINDGRGRFAMVGSFGAADWNSRTVLLADLNGDRRPDIVVANRDRPNQPGGTYMCLNDGRAHFPACALLLLESASDITPGDIDGDGAVDLVLPHADWGQGHVLLNDGQGGFEKKRPFGPNGLDVAGVALGDLDGDGRLDIVLAKRAGGASAYFNQGGAVFSEAVPIGDRGDRLFSVHVADLSGDGIADVVLGMAAMQSAVLLNEGGGRAFTRLDLGDRPGIVFGLAGHGVVYGLASGDLNGDQVPDLVVARAFLPSMVYMDSLNTRARSERTPSFPWRRLIEPD